MLTLILSAYNDQCIRKGVRVSRIAEVVRESAEAQTRTTNAKLAMPQAAWLRIPEKPRMTHSKSLCSYGVAIAMTQIALNEAPL